MQKHLEDLLPKSGIAPEWKALLRDFDRLQHVRIHHRDRDWLVRTDVAKPIAELFSRSHMALPRRAKQMAPPQAASPAKSVPRRRGGPGRSATSSRISRKSP
jgi:hypothetical protein